MSAFASALRQGATRQLRVRTSHLWQHSSLAAGSRQGATRQLRVSASHPPARSGARRLMSAAATAPRRALVDTHEIVVTLEEVGFSRKRAEGVMRSVHSAVAQADAANADVVASKAEMTEMKGELSEKVFNATLKFDIAQRHLREMVQKDVKNLKNELRAAERADSAELRAELNALEKRGLQAHSEHEHRLAGLSTEIAALEQRILRYAVGAGATFVTIALTAARLIM